ncbi:uncharacterized protein LOC114543534 [Dendronephthya gigantea]|uniref:uncharacterized protein LOC114543534 n=1 Tax=Dendronephthya gigantea TaxID=151771 RepID=UPI001068F629|nr:uncharacterized protein LOC114543534 [Dendronephthya gigantea]
MQHCLNHSLKGCFGNVIEGTSSLLQTFLDTTAKKLVDAWKNHHSEEKYFSEIITETLLNDVKSPFNGLDTYFKQVSYIKQNFNYVNYREELLGQQIKRVPKRNKRILVEKEESFIYIPIIESLKQLFTNKTLAKVIFRKPNTCNDEILYDICDGEFFKNDRLFVDHKDALIIIIYHDALEVCNPLGSHTGTHKVDMFYYTLGNLSPKIRSKRCAIRLLAIVKSNLVKKYGYNAILKPIISDIKKLESGHLFQVCGKEKEVFGKVVSCAGDTEGQHEWGGFKVGVGFSFHKCHHCQCHFEAMQEKFFEEDFTVRNKEMHDRHCQEIETAPNDVVKNDLTTTYGINHRSSLCDLQDFDISIQLPQDIMHTLLEGVVQYELRHILLHYITNNTFTLAQLNAAIANQEYGYSEVSDKPGPLKESVFRGDERYKLKYNAAQARLFLRLIPFILSSLVNEHDKFYHLVTELISIVQILFSPVISINTVNQLKDLIAEHLTRFKDCFPSTNIIPKQHYLIHMPSMIKQLGPLIRHSCFAFESAHNFFKETARKQNFKNLTKSLAERCQMNECSNFADSNNPQSHPLFSNERQYGVLTPLNEFGKKSLRLKLDDFGMLPGIVIDNAFKSSWVLCHGTKFRKNAVIMYSVNETTRSPLFATILDIWIVSDFVYFECSTLETTGFSEHYQAYGIEENKTSTQIVFCPYENLVDYNVFREPG